MSIDEYLQIERERGNILTGGGYVIWASVTILQPKMRTESWFMQTTVRAGTYFIGAACS